MKEISKEIIIQATEGSIEFFEDIYRGYSGFVYHVTFRVVNDVGEAEEIT